ncbi:MFS transporter [Prosthecobacter sp.]|nr:MFS transporter [Prosthecobacter sp.]MDI1315076.1 MFS transporter [Prosthecobacter sp.]
MRQHERATMEDKHIELTVQGFHRGTEPPRVRHLLMVNLRDMKP